MKSTGKAYFLINENKLHTSFNQISNDFDLNLTGGESIQIDKKSIKKYVSSLFEDVEVHTYENILSFTSAKQLINFYISNKYYAFVEQTVKKHCTQEFDLYLQRRIN